MIANISKFLKYESLKVQFHSRRGKKKKEQKRKILNT